MRDAEGSTGAIKTRQQSLMAMAVELYSLVGDVTVKPAISAQDCITPSIAREVHGAGHDGCRSNAQHHRSHQPAY